MSAADRYSPSVRIDHAHAFIEVTSLLLQARDCTDMGIAAALRERAWQKFQEHVNDGAFLDFGGALDIQLPKPIEPSEVLGFGIKEFEGSGSWRVSILRQASVRVFEYRGAQALRQLAVGPYPDWTTAAGGMSATVVLDAGEWIISTRIVDPQPDVSYHSMIEVVPTNA